MNRPIRDYTCLASGLCCYVFLRRGGRTLESGEICMMSTLCVSSTVVFEGAAVLGGCYPLSATWATKKVLCDRPIIVVALIWLDNNGVPGLIL